MKRAARLAFEEQQARQQRAYALAMRPWREEGGADYRPGAFGAEGGTTTLMGPGGPAAATRRTQHAEAAMAAAQRWDPEARDSEARVPSLFRAEARSPSRAFRSGREPQRSPRTSSGRRGTCTRSRTRVSDRTARGWARGAPRGRGPPRGRPPRFRRRRTRVTRRARRRVPVRVPPVRVPPCRVCFSRRARSRSRPRPRLEAQARLTPPPRARRRRRRGSQRSGSGWGSRRIRADPGLPGTFLPGAPPRAPTATHALFSSTAEEVTQIVGSSGGTHHARGDGHHHHFHRAFGSAHQHFPVPQQPGAPYAYPAYPGSGSQGPTPPALRGPGLPAHASGALGPAGARIGAAEPPRPSGEQKIPGQKLKRKRGKEAKEERRIASDCAKNADDAGSDSIMTGQPGPRARARRR